MTQPPSKLLISNLSAYFTIAKASHEKGKAISARNKRPKPDGKPGFVITYDPDQESFKHSLIAIVFAGVFLEALLYIQGVKRFGERRWMKEFDRTIYEDKLRALGVTETSLLKACKRFRESRNDLVHEKAVDVARFAIQRMRVAQEEAEHAVSVIDRVVGIVAPPRKP